MISIPQKPIFYQCKILIQICFGARIIMKYLASTSDLCILLNHNLFSWTRTHRSLYKGYIELHPRSNKGSYCALDFDYTLFYFSTQAAKARILYTLQNLPKFSQTVQFSSIHLALNSLNWKNIYSYLQLQHHFRSYRHYRIENILRLPDWCGERAILSERVNFRPS
jgi:hypothetical protein